MYWMLQTCLIVPAFRSYSPRGPVLRIRSFEYMFQVEAEPELGKEGALLSATQQPFICGLVLIA